MTKASTKSDTNPELLIDDVTAILLISPNAKQLAEFYRTTLGIPLEEEIHDDVPTHYGFTFGDVHFAIHPPDAGWPGVPTRNAQSPVINFGTSNVKAAVQRLKAHGIDVTGPTDQGFGLIASFRDPDGNHVSLIEYSPEHW